MFIQGKYVMNISCNNVIMNVFIIIPQVFNLQTIRMLWAFLCMFLFRGLRVKPAMTAWSCAPTITIKSLNFQSLNQYNYEKNLFLCVSCLYFSSFFCM